LLDFTVAVRRSPLPGARGLLARGILVELAVWPAAPGDFRGVAEDKRRAKQVGIGVLGDLPIPIATVSVGPECAQLFRIVAGVYPFAVDMPYELDVVDGLIAGVLHPC
jgi:hypothetical protein